MKKVFLQYWEESERGWGIRPDGCSLHLTTKECKEYIKSIYDVRKMETSVPDEYERIVGEPIEVEIKEELYNILTEQGHMRLYQHQLGNLIKLEEINLK